MCIKMHVFENTKIWDAAKSLHLYFWASKTEFISHEVLKANIWSKKLKIDFFLDKNTFLTKNNDFWDFV